MSLLIPASIASYINADLGPSTSASWINVSWALCASFTVSVAGRLEDIFGRRYFMLGGSLLGLLGTVIGATGQSIGQMIASGVMFGLASGIQETWYACLMELVPKKLRMCFVGEFWQPAIPFLKLPFCWSWS